MKAIIGTTDRHYRQSDYEEVFQSESIKRIPYAYQNDEIDSEIIIISQSKRLQGVTIQFSDFISDSGNILSKSIAEAFFLKETSVHIGRGNTVGVIPTAFPKENIPDILDNIHKKTIHPKALQAVWIKLRIPKNAKSGTYNGKIMILADNVLEKIELCYTFIVFAIQQPKVQRFSIELWQYPFSIARFYGLNSNELFGEQHINLLKEELSEYKKVGGISITTTITENPWNSQTYDAYPSMVKWIKNIDGKFQFDFTIFDRYVQLALDLGISKQIKSFSISPWNDSISYYDEFKERMILKKYEPGSFHWKAIWGVFLDAYMEHLDEKNWFDFAYISMDERSTSDMKEVIALLEQHTNKDNKRIKISVAVNHLNLNEELLEKIDDLSIILSCVMRNPEMVAELVKKRRKQNQTTTLYTCAGEYPNSFSRSAPAESAWIIWYAESIGMDGFLRWGYDAWVENPEVSVDHWYWEGGDPFLVYPSDKNSSSKIPRTSPRFERLKEAKRQVEKLRFIKECIPEIRDEIDSFVRTLICASGICNCYGAMESPSSSQDILIGNEVARMNQKIGEWTIKYLISS